MHVDNCYKKPTWSVRIHCFSTFLEAVENSSANRLEFCENTVLPV